MTLCKVGTGRATGKLDVAVRQTFMLFDNNLSALIHFEKILLRKSD